MRKSPNCKLLQSNIFNLTSSFLRKPRKKLEARLKILASLYSKPWFICVLALNKYVLCKNFLLLRLIFFSAI